ncbi:KR domain-containing protein [Kibdelosporangium aridum]|uniref:KR domain-containing protein n=1 Tax=Kibdelosporangium aridum TaxID=2030 RepID=A0A428YS89_KIBAR|nr:oxidoreductase [Kibdelosporangium aridum]RSM72341.1 KR domain-containing protein [Kibdelosporangium aridum]
MSIWFITGASRGLGRSITKAALAAGHNVVATARTPSQLDDLAAEHPATLRPLAVDVTDPAAVASAVKSTVDLHGRIDVVVNNAGYANMAPIETMDPADFRAQVETNFFGAVEVTRAVLPTLRAQRSGHVVQISSIGGRVGAPGMSAYQSAKWAVEGFSEVLAAETAPFGVKVTIVEPGFMRTDWAGSSMRIADVPAEYQGTVGQIAEHLRDVVDSAPIDPDKAASAILHVTEVDDPPLRLLIGSDAADIAAGVARRRSAEDAKWDELSRSVNFDGASTTEWRNASTLAESYDH